MDTRLSARGRNRDKARPQWTALWHEWRIYATSHPFALVLSELARWMGPVVTIPGLGYVVNDPELARAVLEQEDVFSKTGPGSMGVVITQVMGPYALFNMHGPAHHALRARLTDLFATAYLDRLSAQVLTPPIARLRDDLEAGRRVDLVRFMHLLSGRLMCDMLGVPVDPKAAERIYLEMWNLGEELVSILRLSTTHLRERQVRDRRAVLERLVSYMRDAYERADATSSDSVIQRLRQLGLPFEEVKGVTAALFLAGTQTVSTALPRLVALLIDTHQVDLLRERPALLTRAIDEGLRMTVPTPIMLRSVVRDVTIDGHHFRAGGRVMIHTYNVLKHPGWFRSPRRFDIERSVDRRVRHLWFGGGAHFCIGFTLAHRELRLVTEALLSLPSEVHIVHRAYAHRVFIPAYSRLELEVRR